MLSDFLDAHNPDRLTAFFMYTDTALMAEQGIATIEEKLKDSTPEMRACVCSLMEGMRQRATLEAINLFNGGGIKVVLPSPN